MIRGFNGEHRFLSNFWPAKINYQGFEFPSVEHAYQASKSADPTIWRDFAELNSPGLAKRAGRNLVKREDWDEVKEEHMYLFNVQKYRDNSELRNKLLKTGDVYIEETNTWGDTFWGVCAVGDEFVGENKLGIILMLIRDELRAIDEATYD